MTAILHNALYMGTIGILTAVSPLGAADVTNTFQDGVSGYTGTRDAYIVSTSSNSNYGSEAFLHVGTPLSGSYEYFLRWDLSSIPTNATVLSATADLVKKSAAASSTFWFPCKRNWVESEITWTQYAAGHPWEKAGGLSSLDKGNEIIARYLSDGAGPLAYSMPFNPDGLALVQSWIRAPAGNFGIKAEAVANPTISGSSESATKSNRPKLTVVYTLEPQPEIQVFRSGLEVFTGDDEGMPEHPPGVVLPITYVITNAGAATLNLDATPVTVSSPTNCSVSVTTQPSSRIAAGSASSAVVSVTPTVSGHWCFSVSIPNNDRSGSENPFVWTVTGVAWGPDIEVKRNGSVVANGGTNAVGTLYNGTAQQLLYLVSNKGNQNLTNGTATVSRLVNCAASVATSPQTVLLPDDSSAMILSITPSGGAFSLRVALPNNDPSVCSYELLVTGTGSGTPPVATGPEIAVKGNNVEIPSGSTSTSANNFTDFGLVEAVRDHKSLTRFFVIENQSQAVLNMTGSPRVTLSGANASDFSVSAQPANSVAGYGMTPFQITFTPSTTGVRMASVTIFNTDANEPDYTFAIKGTGYERPLQYLVVGNSFIAPRGVQPVYVIKQLALAKGHPEGNEAHHSGGNAQISQHRYGRTSDLKPMWWERQGVPRGIIYEHSFVSRANYNKKWDYFIVLCGRGFSNLLPPCEIRMVPGVPDGEYFVPDMPNEEMELDCTKFLFEKMRNHSPKARVVLYEGWVRAPHGDWDWYTTNPRTPIAYWYSQVEAQWAYMSMQQRLKRQADDIHGQDTALINRISDAWRAKDWKEDASGLYRWFGEDNIDHHLSSRGVLLAGMCTYTTMYREGVSDVRSLNPSIVSNVLAKINASPNGKETPLTTADWDELADLTDRLNGMNGYPKILVSVNNIGIPERGTANFQVKLSSAPTSTIGVTVTNTYGNTNITVTVGSALTFTPSNWNDWQSVTVADSGTATNGALIALYSAEHGVFPPAGPAELLAGRAATPIPPHPSILPRSGQ